MMAAPLGWCVEAVRAATGPELDRALLALRSHHTRRPGGAARFRERGGLGPLLELLGPERPRRSLELALSALGNCCTEPGCRRLARALGGVARLVALLAAPEPETLHNRVARTLANLALEPDGAQDILDAGAGPLLISLASSCLTPECLHSAARALRILATSPPPRRALCRAGAVGTLASRLASLAPTDPALGAVARALRCLTAAPCPSADELAPALPALAALATDGKREWRAAALGAIANACARGPLRPALGAAGAVEAVATEVRRVLAASPDSGGNDVDTDGSPGPAAVRALCLLCREAVNRARVRAQGGLPLLLRLLAEPRARPWRPRVLLALAAFAYDQEALVAMDAHGVAPLLADVLRARGKCWPGGNEEEELEEEEDEDEAAASCDLPRDLPRANGAATGSLRGLRSWLLSEAPSPPSSPSPPPPTPPHCPSPPSPPPLRRRLPPMGALALPRGVGEGDPWLPEAPALLLLARLAAADQPSRALATPPVVSGLLRYLTGVPEPAPRATRLLQQLIGHPAFLATLVRTYVPSLLHSWLVLGIPPPRAEELSRPGGPPETPAAAPGPRQTWLRELGESLLSSLGTTAAAPFGLGVLTHMLSCGSPPARLACATALPLLARPSSPVRGLLWGGGAVALLLSAVAQGPPEHLEPPPAFTLYAADAITQLPLVLEDGATGDPLGNLEGLLDQQKDLEEPSGDIKGLEDPDDSWWSLRTHCSSFPVAPSPQGSPDPLFLGSPPPLETPKAARRPRVDPDSHSSGTPGPPKCPRMSADPPSQGTPRPPKCPQTPPSPPPHSLLCPQMSPDPPNPPLEGSPRPLNCPQSPSTSPPLVAPVAPCPYSQSPHDLLLLPNGAQPGVPVARAALARGSPVLGAMLGGSFLESRLPAVALGSAPRRPLLLLLHYLHGCRGPPCPLLTPPLPPRAADAALLLARRYLVADFEELVAASVVAAPGTLWALAERWASGPLATRVARALVRGPPHLVAPSLAQAARVARCPPRLARALLAAVAPGDIRVPLDMGEPWGGTDPLLGLPGAGDEEVGEPYEEANGDPNGDPPVGVGDHQQDLGDHDEGLGDPEDEGEVKGPL